MISIIIPCLNESDLIGNTLQYLVRSIDDPCEIIAVDGGSTDHTIDIVKGYPQVRILISPKQSRAAQMNYGATHAKGEIYYFLHADSLPPENFVSIIHREISKGVDLGNFSVRFNPSSILLKINEWVTRKAFLYQGGGDQSLFIRKDVFNDLGGYDESYVIMEEYEFLSRAKNKYNFELITAHAVTTSSRKYQKNNYLKIQLSNLYIMILYQRGVDPSLLKEKYKALLK